MIAPRRMSSSSLVRSARSLSRSDFQRSSTGITRSLQTMVESAIVSTITMPVAAESPPTNTNSARTSCWWAIGSVSTKVSASTPRAEEQQPAERDRQDEDVDQQQVEREEPDRLSQVASRRRSRPPRPGTAAAGKMDSIESRVSKAPGGVGAAGVRHGHQALEPGSCCARRKMSPNPS